MKNNNKVDFIIIGAMKSGTTSLANDLSKHPSIYFSVNKEPGYFNQEQNWSKNIKKYNSLFLKSSAGQLWGEASTQYTMYPEYEETHLRLKEYNPELKLIYIMRDPVNRIISHFAHNYVRKRVSANFENVIRGNSSYITRSKYYYQLSPYLETFRRDQLFLLTFEEYIANPRQSLKSIADFLCIDSSFYRTYDVTIKNSSTGRNILPESGLSRLFVPLKKYRHYFPKSIVNAGLEIFGNRKESIPNFPSSFKTELYSCVREDIQKLEKLLGRKLSEWHKYDLE